MNEPVKKLSLRSLAIPILVEQILRNLMGTVNVFMLGRISDDAVAAVGVANQIMNIVICAFTFLGIGGAVLINHAIGARKYRDSAILSMNAVTVAGVIGLFFSTLLIFGAAFFIRAVGLQEELVPMGASYLRIMGGACVPIALSFIISNIFRSYGGARIPMLVVILNNILNIGGACIVIFRPFETPLVGSNGLAFVRMGSEVIGLLVLLAFLMRSHHGFQFVDCVRVKLKNFRDILYTGLMTGLEGICYNLAQVVTTGFITGLGATMISAKVYVQSVDFYASIIGFSIGQAGQIIVGQMMGAEQYEEAYRYMNRVWRYIITSNLFFTITMFLLSRQLMSLFTANPEIIAIARQLFFINIITFIGRSFNHSAGHGLRSAGYVFVTMLLCVASIWVCTVGLGYIFTAKLHLGVAGLYLGIMVDEWVRGGSMLILWIKRVWKKGLIEKHAAMRRAEQTETGV